MSDVAEEGQEEGDAQLFLIMALVLLKTRRMEC